MINSQKIKLALVEHMIWVIIIGVSIIFSLTISNFFTVKNFLFILYASSALGFLVLGGEV
ncbi:unnamed protein product [marine sediment metagenome]|uniref:Uncharacterized protein n=1 Tax=marine sediment metagenome TaxID=412755 RepID=X0ZKI4_9ZZZZ